MIEVNKPARLCVTLHISYYHTLFLSLKGESLTEIDVFSHALLNMEKAYGSLSYELCGFFSGRKSACVVGYVAIPLDTLGFHTSATDEIANVKCLRRTRRNRGNEISLSKTSLRHRVGLEEMFYRQLIDSFGRSVDCTMIDARECGQLLPIHFTRTSRSSDMECR
ncbi:hypothetical protein V2G26_000640 [Clonostachys chloroleuca]